MIYSAVMLVYISDGVSHLKTDGVSHVKTYLCRIIQALEILQEPTIDFVRESKIDFTIFENGSRKLIFTIFGNGSTSVVGSLI